MVASDDDDSLAFAMIRIDVRRWRNDRRCRCLGGGDEVDFDVTDDDDGEARRC